MGLRRRILTFGYPLLEILAFWAVGALVGFGWAFVALLAGIPVGFLMWRQAAHYLQPSQPEKAAAWGAAGLLWLIPGFLTDILGVLVVIPPIRRQLVGVLSRHVPMNLRFSQVVVGEVIHTDTPGSASGARPNGAILGEVVPTAPQEAPQDRE